MTIKKVEIVSDENGTSVKLNNEKLQGVNFVQLRADSECVPELTLRVDIIQDSMPT